MIQMKPIRAAALLLIIQLLLVLSIGGKYLYERKTRPRIWVLSSQYDPNTPLRGRYLALQLLVNACNLPRNKAHFEKGFENSAAGLHAPGFLAWNISLQVADGHIVPKAEEFTKRSRDTELLMLLTDKPCDRVPLPTQVDYFIPDTAKGPFPLKPGQQLWVEVTMPPSGPPRPIQLAVSSDAGFQPLHPD